MQSDEIKKIELIVNDIAELREQNKVCQKKLKYKKKLEEKSHICPKKDEKPNKFPKLILKEKYLKYKSGIKK